MTAAEVLAMLKLTKNKQTTAYASKLASLMQFLNATRDIRIGAEVVEADLNIEERGKVLPLENVRKDYIDEKVRHFEGNDPGIEKIRCKITELGTEVGDNYTILRRKNTDAKQGKARARNAEIDTEQTELRKSIENLVTGERQRLEAIEFTIQEMRDELKLFAGAKFRVNIETQRPFVDESAQYGGYTFIVPTGNSYYRAVCNTLKISMADEETEKPHIKRMVTMPAEVLQAIKKAAKFVSNDDLRPVMGCVALEVRENKLLVVSTDAHRLFKSREFDVTGPPGSYTYLIPASQLKRLPRSVEMPFMFYELADNKAHFLGLDIAMFTDAKFPDWRCVMPNYDKGIVFDRADMIGIVKETMIYANKSTNEVRFNFNGDIELSAQDVDFSFESTNRMRYKSKTMDDLTIAFNGKMLIDGLAAFKSEEITLQADAPNKPGILTDGVDTVLIMPLMINN